MKAYLHKVFWRQLLIHLPILVCLLSGHWQAALVCLGITALIIGYASLAPATRMLGPVTTRIDKAGVLITLDDGPDPVTTPALLELLDRHQAKAVFFLIGNRVERWPDLAREIVRRGHVVGNHSQTHPSAMFWALGPWRMWREINGCQQTLQRVLGGKAPVWFRAPVGHYNTFVHPALEVLGLRLMSWSCRGFDGTYKNLDTVLRLLRKDLKPGAIVLLHEAVPHCTKVLEGVLATMEERGLKALSLEEAGL